MRPKVVFTGAGSGGHITPLLAVAKELKQLHSDVDLVFIGQTGDSFAAIVSDKSLFDQVYSIRAGKFRRYHGEGLKQLLDLPTWFFNIRDFGFFLAGLVQSWRLLKRLRPTVIFIKGGYVGVPVGLAAARLKIPYITHDSDAVPGLANRLIARWASIHAVALPAATYDYPPDKTVTTGVPIRADFKKVSPTRLASYRRELGISSNAKVLLIVGGGQGSKQINESVADIVPHLLAEFDNLSVFHVAGALNETLLNSRYKSELAVEQQARVKVLGFVDSLYRYSGAADVIVTRAGATNLAEFAAQAKACIVIPSPYLAGGHQLKNALYLEEQAATLVLSEEDLVNDPNRLAPLISELFKHPSYRRELAVSLAKFSNPKAAEALAKLILSEI